MRPGRLAIVIGLWGALAAVAPATAEAGSAQPADAVPREPALDPEAALKASQAAIGRQPADYAFLDRSGRQVRLADYRGKPLLVSFVYTGCMSACPPTTKLLADAIRKARGVVGSDSFRVLTIGFNLPYDSPQAMRDFSRRFGLDAANWEFLTPFDAQLNALTADFGFSYRPTSWGFDHITQVTVVDRDGRIYRQVYGDTFSLWLLIDPLKELIEGTPVPVRSLADFVERVRILCTVYDPNTNTYRFKTTIIGEIVSFVAITVALAWFVWFERRRRRKVRGRST
jgi:protein SCO1/2